MARPALTESERNGRDILSGLGVFSHDFRSTSPASKSIVVPWANIKNVALPDPVLIW